MPPLFAESPWSAPVHEEDVSTPAQFTPDPKYTDEAVLSIVVQDYNTAATWQNDRKWTLQWEESLTLYQSPRTNAVFEGSSVTRANVSRFTVAKQVNSIAPAITGAVFSDPTPFEIRPRPNSHQNTARAWKELIAMLLDLCDFKSELGYGIEGMVNQGTVIFKIGWEKYTEMVTTYKRKAAPEEMTLPLGGYKVQVNTKESDEFEAVTEEVQKQRPFFEKKELGTIFPNPKWRSPNQMWKSGWVVEESYVTYDDLMKLRQNPDYDIPDDETLRFIFTQDYEPTKSSNNITSSLSDAQGVHQAADEDTDFTADPLLKPMQLLEWSSNNEVRTVLQQKVVIRNGKHGCKTIPYLSANFWNIENAGWGMGCGRIAGSDQRVDQGTINAALDIIAFAVQPEYTVARGANIPTQDERRRLGGIRKVDGFDATKAVALVPQPQVPPDAWRAIQISNQVSDATTGADQAAVQGALPGRGSSVGRSGTGAGMIQSAAQGRIQAPVERVIDGILIPFLNFLWQMVHDHMTTGEIRTMLGDAMTEDLLVDFNDFLNAKIRFDTLAGTRLAARTRMAQSLPFLLEIFGNQALVSQMSAIGWKVNVLEVVNMVMDVSEWKNKRDLIVPMTDQEKQQQAMNNPAVVQAQTQQQLQAQKQQDALQLEEVKIKGRIAAKTIDKAATHLVASPDDRASALAQRAADERAINQSQFFGSV
jgi:hypothetical protein